MDDNSQQAKGHAPPDDRCSAPQSGVRVRILIVSQITSWAEGLAREIESLRRTWVSTVVAETIRDRSGSPGLVTLLAGEDAARLMSDHLRESAPTVLLWDRPEIARAVPFIRLGVSAILGASCDAPRLVRVIEEVLAGSVVFEASIMEAVGAGTLPALTERQRQILLLLGRGRSTREIAAEVGVAEVTVRTHIRRLAVRYGCSGRNELMAAAQWILAPGHGHDSSVRGQTAAPVCPAPTGWKPGRSSGVQRI